MSEFVEPPQVASIPSREKIFQLTPIKYTFFTSPDIGALIDFHGIGTKHGQSTLVDYCKEDYVTIWTTNSNTASKPRDTELCNQGIVRLIVQPRSWEPLPESLRDKRLLLSFRVDAFDYPDAPIEVWLYDERIKRKRLVGEGHINVILDIPDEPIETSELFFYFRRKAPTDKMLKFISVTGYLID